MFCFDNIAKRIVGKSCEAVIKSIRHPTDTPPDLAAIISLKFTFAITITDASYHLRKKVFQINSILASHGKQHLPTNAHEQAPSTPPKLPLLTLIGDSPTTAMQKLQTTTPSPSDSAPIDIVSTLLSAFLYYIPRIFTLTDHLTLQESHVQKNPIQLLTNQPWYVLLFLCTIYTFAY